VTSRPRWAPALLTLALLTGACADTAPPDIGSESDPGGSVAPPETAATTGDGTTSTVPEAPTAAPEPFGWVGEGTAITMARASSSDGFVRAEIVRLLLTELGYVVNDLENIELSPAYFHEVLGNGEVDLWADGRQPDDAAYWTIELADGSTVADHVTSIGDLVPEGRLEGFVVDRMSALAIADLTLDRIDADDEVRERFIDRSEEDSPGSVLLLGCAEERPCGDQIDEQIRFAGWVTIEQRRIDSTERADLVLDRVADGAPVIAHLTSPSAAAARLIPGENVVWLSVDPTSVLDGSITAAWNQRVDGVAAAAPVAATTCSTDPCVLSWRHTRLTVTARVDFLDDNPEAAALLASISIPAADLSEAILRQEEGTDPRQLAIEWVAANRSLVDGWLGAAISG